MHKNRDAGETRHKIFLCFGGMTFRIFRAGDLYHLPEGQDCSGVQKATYFSPPFETESVPKLTLDYELSIRYVC